MSENRCENCRHWARPDQISNRHLSIDDETIGECRAHSPSGIFGFGMVDNDGRFTSFIRQFPPTPPTDWCGDHATK